MKTDYSVGNTMQALSFWIWRLHCRNLYISAYLEVNEYVHVYTVLRICVVWDPAKRNNYESENIWEKLEMYESTYSIFVIHTEYVLKNVILSYT